MSAHTGIWNPYRTLVLQRKAAIASAAVTAVLLTTYCYKQYWQEHVSGASHWGQDQRIVYERVPIVHIDAIC
ncbi:hypothetical protein BDV98DRAFT_560578 [Pterulicium gracile]|uniref:Uncharacterized protein n=1 Tax=Pterulicium gracile TaxID=1884261 RepID=A0A5C3QUV6_9AGAR|nr:hypothetical protein BDV98DRAFT_560578 [Pterula gracilis]